MAMLHRRTLQAIGLLAGSEKSLAQLAEGLSINKSMAHRLLSGMEKEGLLKSRIVKTKNGRLRVFGLAEFSLVLSSDPGKGNLLSYRSTAALDPDRPLLGQIMQEGPRAAVRIYLKALKSLPSKSAIVLFGSAARGDATRKSDLDLLFLADGWQKADENRIRNILADAVITAGLQAISHFRTFSEFLNDGTSMGRSIKREGIILDIQGEVGDLWKAMQRYKSIWL